MSGLTPGVRCAYVRRGVWGKTVMHIAMVSRSRLHDPPTDGLCGHWREGTLHQATV